MKNKETDNVLKVAMFGGFSMNYNDVPLAFGRAYRLKYIQLFQLLLLNQAKGIAKDVLLENLYGMQDGANRNNSLNNLIFRLRKHLLELGFAASDDIVLKNGRCFLVMEEEIEVDVLEFQRLVKQANQEKDTQKKADILFQAVELYQGELLPQISTELWVTVESLQCKRQLEEAVKVLGGLLQEDREFHRLRSLYGRLAQIYPLENWQEKEIECLMSMNQHQEACQLYQSTVDLYIEELGVPPTGEYLKRFQAMGKKLSGQSENIRAIQQELQEQKPFSGAYYCCYPSFIDSYRLMSRLMERNGQSVYLMLCTLVDAKGAPLNSHKMVAKKMEWLFEAMGRAMRSGDVYTKYSVCQYLALLLGTNQEDCSIVSSRIDQKYMELSGGGRREVQYYVTSLATIPDEPDKHNFRRNLGTWGGQSAAAAGMKKR